MSDADWAMAHFSIMFALTALAYAGAVLYFFRRYGVRKLTLCIFILSGVSLLCVGSWALIIAYNHGWIQP